MLAIFGLVVATVFHLRWGILVLFPVAGLVFGTFAVADRLNRYALMGDWLVLICGALGLWWLMWILIRGKGEVFRFFRRNRVQDLPPR